MNLKIIIENVEIDRKYIEEDVIDFVKLVKNSMKNSLNNLLTLKTNRNKERNKKEDFFFARFDDFFLNFAYRNELTKNCLFNFLKKNDVNIDDATLILNSIAETIEKRKKKYRSINFKTYHSKLTFYYTKTTSVKFFFIEFEYH